MNIKLSSVRRNNKELNVSFTSPLKSKIGSSFYIISLSFTLPLQFEIGSCFLQNFTFHKFRIHRNR